MDLKFFMLTWDLLFHWSNRDGEKFTAIKFEIVREELELLKRRTSAQRN